MSGRNGSRIIVNRSRGAGQKIRSPSKTKDGRAGLRRLKEVPSLKEFLHRQNVMHQYRGFFRAVNQINDEKFRAQARNEIRQSYAPLKNESDVFAISMAIKEGEKKLRDLRSMVGYIDERVSGDADSWLNIQDEEDPRGRVGTSWPWERKDSGDDKDIGR